MLNNYRDIERSYDALEAWNVTKKFDNDLSIDSLYEVFTCTNPVFSRVGMSKLFQSLRKICKRPFSAVYTCYPYTFMISKLNDLMLIIDTHPVPSNSGGNGNGLLFIAQDTDHPYADICMWL